MKTYKALTDRRPVPLTSGFVFTYVFGAAQSTEILRSLLSAVDVKATDVTGATYTMEAQATWRAAFASRECCPEAPQLMPLTDFIIHFVELPQFIR